MVRIVFNIDLEIPKGYENAYRTSFIKTIELIYSKIYEYAPTGRRTRGALSIRQILSYDFDFNNKTAWVGIPDDSPLADISDYLEYGTGERGSLNFKSFIGEGKPEYTIPIVPIKAKALHFIDDEGNDVFFTKGKWQTPQPFVRRALAECIPIIPEIWRKEFQKASADLN